MEISRLEIMLLGGFLTLGCANSKNFTLMREAMGPLPTDKAVKKSAKMVNTYFLKDSLGNVDSVIVRWYDDNLRKISKKQYDHYKKLGVVE